MLLVVLLSPKMLNAGNTFAGGQPFSGLLRAGFITLGVRKIKIVPLSQKHAQQYTHTPTLTRRQAMRVCICVSWKSTCCGKLPKKRAGQAEKQALSYERGQAVRRRGGRAQMCCALFVPRASPCRRICLHNQSCYPCFAHTHTYRQDI